MTKIGKKILTAVTAAACILSVGACGGNGGARPEATAAPNATTTAPAQTTTTTPPATLAEEAKEAINEIETDLPELENKEVHLLACFDLNPRGGQVKSPALEMFETKLGGKNYLLVTDQEEGDGMAMILRDDAEEDAEESLYAVVEDENELSAALLLFSDKLEEMGILIEE